MENHTIKNETEEEEEITIYLKVSKTVALKVKESDSIGKVKSLLHDKEGIPERLQQLFSKGIQLMDEQKLVDYGIIKNSTLHAYVDNSVPRIFLVKRPYAGGAITVYSRICDTIQDVKFRIGAKEGIKSNDFSLIHGGKFLEDDKTLAFYKIDGGSTLHMVLKPRDKLLIYVEMPKPEIVQIEVNTALTVRDIKTVIESKVSHSMDDMDLFLGKQELEDSKKLYQYDIDEDCFLQVKPRTMQILIKKWSGGSIMLDVHSHTLVENVKGMLLKKLGIPVHLQKLVFEGKFLADSRDLASYNIKKHSNVFLDFRCCNATRIQKDPLSNIKSYQQIKLCTIKGVISSATSVAHLKTLIRDELKLHVKELLLGGKLLDSLCCLGEYGITKNTELLIAC
ncbi:polyubiquitin-like isoform X1 [Lycium ferocissimum]|uniref:polyubiquitin-like isoform X1 n=1 Tax=Lycium ferocissimum TaxID=112874 RepID=UPI0028168EEE|nr:polyubiquitin-like isoform X1 [Lycium ferocissimum]